MPTMTEIYRQHAFEYDELVAHEDFQNNLGAWLMEQIDWENNIVCEAGAGTGRVTSLYINKVRKAYLFDRSAHMLQSLERKLKTFRDKIAVKESEHLAISLEEKADIFIEGWSFGHLVIENSEHVDETIDEIVTMIGKNLKPTGTSIIIETLGTNVPSPNPPRDILAMFYRALEEKYGYTKNILRTDYKFESVEEASRIMGFFFGAEMGMNIQLAGKTVIQEFTGVWVK